MKNRTTSLLTIFDNYNLSSKCKKGWGFSCFIRYKNQGILFDTGANEKVLLSNMEELKVNPEEIDFIFISHLHHDHTGGLPGVLRRNSKAKVYKPNSFKKPTEIREGVFTTGSLGNTPKEQSLILDTRRGLVIITGCAHPGVQKIVRKAKEIQKGKEVYLVLGGFHLSSASDKKIKDIISDFKKLGVKKVAPSHCSGDRCRQLFREEYGKDFIKNGVGKEIKI